jgi:CheY-like chemotaxis protein
MSTATHSGIYPGVPAGTTALVVEDDYASAVALRALLERRNMTVVGAESGAVALATLDGADGDDVRIVLMDIMMPFMNGYEAIAAIRRRPGLAELPIIALTAKDADGERERCLAAGATDFMQKPIDVSALLTAVAALLTTPPEDLAPTP